MRFTSPIEQLIAEVGLGGHEDQFLPLRLSARSVIRKQTVAATRGNGRDAPISLKN
jgi:hypothetical protein